MRRANPPSVKYGQGGAQFRLGKVKSEKRRKGCRLSLQPNRLEEDIMTKDPVCGLQIDEKQAAAKGAYKGRTYYFCSPTCKTEVRAKA